MPQMVLPGLAIILMLVVWLNTLLRRADRIKKRQQESLDTILRNEHEANFVSQKPINEDLFLRPDVSEFMLSGELPEELSALQRRFLKSSEKEMVVLNERLTNLEVKKRFGGKSLELIAAYEQNATRYFIAANNYAEALIKHGYKDTAENLLKVLIKENCDVSKTYMLLTDIYGERGDKDSLETLKKTVDASSLKMKSKVTTYIDEHIPND